MAKINVMVENLTDNTDARTVLLEGVEVDFDKLMALLTGKPMPRKPRTPKAKPVTVEPVAPVEVKAEPAPVVAKVEPPKAETPKASKPRKGGFRRRKSGNPITVPLTDCIGVGLYPTKKGPKAVAILKLSSQSRVEILLWIDDNNETASHDDGGFPNTQGKLYNVEMF